MVNGFSGIFMVASVEAVSGSAKLRRDEPRTPVSDIRKESSGKVFARILEKNLQETKATSGMDCNTTTYGRDSMIRDFAYQTREYHY